MQNTILVAIQCTVYNHEPYLRDCLDGFVMQKTNFRFVAIVHDDASKDNSAAIIREYAEKYPDIIKPIYETENQYSKHDGSLGRIMNEAVDATGAKYVALCEGDDYWIDENKLQKQIDILEADTTLMACVSDTSIVDQFSNTTNPKRGGVVKDDIEGRYNLRDFLGTPQHAYPTATVLYRLTHKEEVRQKCYHTRNAYLGDWTLWIILHTYGNFYYINEPLAAYRINPTSVTHTYDRVGRAKASVHICNAVADILPAEYADIAEDLRHTEWVWISLMHAYKATGKYFGLIYATFMAAIKCPGLLYNEIRRVLKKS